jgi:uncharacterized protein (TIGR00297 family)
MSILLSYLVAGVIGYLGYRARALTWDGAVAACVVGGTIFGFGGLGWAVLLVVFFVSSSLLSFVGAKDARKRRASETFDKGGRRDAWQVVANGGVAAVAALGAGMLDNWLVYPNVLIGLNLMFGAFVGALAEATADTWATEIGVLSKSSPRLVTTGKRVEPGTSGGVTLMGSGAGVIGAILTGWAASMISPFNPSNAGAYPDFLGPEAERLPIFIAASAGGIVGMLADSLLGATVQAQYYCPKCDKPTESRIHRCGTITTLVSGVAWMNNDVVNIAGTAVGALVGASVALILPITHVGIL